MNRRELVTQLELLVPGLATNDVVASLTHFCFNSKEIVTFNSKVGVSTPYPTDFETLIPGRPLLNILKASTTKDIELNYSPERNEITGDMKSTKLRLTTRDRAEFKFEMPEPPTDTVEVVGGTERLFEAIKICLKSVTSDTSSPDHIGITLIPDKKTLGLYSWGNDCISHAFVTLKQPLDCGRVLIPGEFFQAMIDLVDPMTKKLQLEITKDHILLQLPQGGLLHGSLINMDQPFDFTYFIKLAREKTTRVPIPKKLPAMIERANLVIADEKILTRISVNNNRLKFETRGKISEITDTTMIDEAHPEVVCKTNVKFLALADYVFEEIGISEDGVVFTGENCIYIVSSAAG